MFISGYRKGATLPLALVGANLALVYAAAIMGVAGFSPWSKLALAAIAFVFGTSASAVGQRVYRRELNIGYHPYAFDSPPITAATHRIP